MSDANLNLNKNLLGQEGRGEVGGRTLNILKVGMHKGGLSQMRMIAYKGRRGTIFGNFVCMYYVDDPYSYLCHESNVKLFYPQNHKCQFDVKSGSLSMQVDPKISY